jgi:hypothetical protein
MLSVPANSLAVFQTEPSFGQRRGHAAADELTLQFRKAWQPSLRKHEAASFEAADIDVTASILTRNVGEILFYKKLSNK